MKKILLFFVLIICASAQHVFAQSRQVKGKVYDENGFTFPGVGVTVKGTTLGGITESDGSFQLEVPNDKSILIFMATGYTPQDVKITGGALEIHMKPEAKALKEMVVTALGINKEKRSLGYSISEVSSEDVYKSGEQNIVEALADKAPGVNITSSSGTAGASSKIIIRGNNSFANNQPLFVVDGIPVDNSTNTAAAGDNPFNANLAGVSESNRALDINPDDIESVSVLRGPAAASLYGQVGANGAILITTKKGKYGKGKGIGITYSSSMEVTTVNKLPALQDKYLQGDNGVFNTFSAGPDGLVGTADDIMGTPNSWGPRKDTAGMKTYNKYNDFFKTGMAYNNSISMTGGNENAIFRSSISNYTNTGVIPGSKLNRTTVNVSGESKMTNWLTVGASANYTNTAGERVQNGSTLGGVMLTLLRAPINVDITKSFNPVTGQGIRYYGIYDNPLFTVNHNPYTDQTNRIFGNMYANAKINSDFSINWKVGTDAYTTNTRQIFDLSSMGDDANSGLGQVNRSTLNYRNLYSDFIVKYDKKLPNKFELNAFIGHNFWYTENSYMFTRGTGQQIPNMYNLAYYSTLYGSNTESYERRQAIYGDAALSYNSEVYLTLTGRNEWTTAFGKNSAPFFFPNADLAWIFTERVKPNDILNYGKIRLAYADAGVGPQPYTNLNYFSVPFITDGYTNGNGFPYLGQVGLGTANTYNPGGLRAAHVQGKEVGLDLKMFKKKLSIEAVYYDQISKDNLLAQPVAYSTGYQYQYINAGQIENKGVELHLGLDVLKTKDLQWNIGMNYSKNISKVLSLTNGLNSMSIESGFSDIGAYAVVGQPYGVLYGTAWDRDPKTGKILVDANGQAMVASQAKVIGNPNPDYLLGITSSLTYKNFNFSFLIDIKQGGDIWNGTWARLNRIGMSDASADREKTYVIDGVYAPGTPNAGQANTTAVTASYYYKTFKGDGGSYAAENAIQDGSWIRLRSVNLSYRIKLRAKNTKSIVDYLDLGITAKNLILITPYKGVDPETSLTGAGSNISGFDYFNNPGTKSFLFNVRVGL
ncbi:MAG: SusC/RagA family TonB-linked outer membrane protein [Bacteroidota bacterium]